MEPTAVGPAEGSSAAVVDEGGEVVPLRLPLRLRFVHGSLAGSEAELTAPAYSLGRSADNDLAFDATVDRATSGRHAVLRRDGGDWLLEDLGSTNGTWVGGHRINAPHKLATGQRITLGDDEAGVVFDVAVGDWPAEPTPPAAAPVATPQASQPPPMPVIDAGKSEGGFFGAVGGAYRRFKATRELQRHIDAAQQQVDAIAASARPAFEALGKSVSASPELLAMSELDKVEAVKSARANRAKRAASENEQKQADAAVEVERNRLREQAESWEAEERDLSAIAQEAATRRDEAQHLFDEATQTLRETLSPVDQALQELAEAAASLRGRISTEPAAVTPEALKSLAEQVSAAASDLAEPPADLEAQRRDAEMASEALKEVTGEAERAQKALADAKSAHAAARAEQEKAIADRQKAADDVRASQRRLDEDLARGAGDLGRGLATAFPSGPVFEGTAGGANEALQRARAQAADLSAAEARLNELKIQLANL